MEPAELRLRDGPRRSGVGEVRVLRLRVYVSSDYRAQTLQWQAHLQRLIERVNRVTAGWPGVRFEVVEIRRWDRVSASASLEQLLQDLEKTDAGRDVDWVMGLAAAVPLMPTQIHNLGMARELGRHFVIRNLHDLAEYDLFRSALDEMSAGERDQLLSVRKAHKEVVVFLHEWAHTLGVLHARHWQRIMNPAYHQGQMRFSDGEARMIEMGLQRRDAAEYYAELGRVVAGESEPEWDAGERQRLLTLLATPPPRSSEPAEALLAKAEAELRAHVEGRAEALLAEAEALLPATGAPQLWGKASALRRELCSPSLAVVDAQHAGVGDEVARWAAEARRYWLIPEDAASLGLSPAKEGDYARQVRLIFQALDGKMASTAEVLTSQLSIEFPRLPIRPLVRCVIDMRRGALTEAQMECAEALVLQRDAAPIQQAMIELASRQKASRDVVGTARRVRRR